MQIKSNKKNKKRNILMACVIVALLIAGGVGWFYYTYSDGNPSTDISSDKKATSTKDKNTQATNNETPVPDKTTPDTDSTPATDSDTTTGVATPSTRPGNTDPYPVTNEHYQIKQISTTNFEITLFPVINNPEYADYNSQLRAYKKEALNYLTDRYGSIDGFGIDWNPEDAENL